MTNNKNKIINDPIYGFITIYNELIFEIIEHPYFQRLRRINQLGLTNLVYPGANHTRFHHALGSMHLMEQTLLNLRVKNVEISDEEFEGCLIAILLHDIGHGPFSHTLEHCLLQQVSHEDLSLIFIERLNVEFDNKLSLAIKIFVGTYERNFFHALVSSQLDIDRLDYLKRDSFFTGVSEGSIGSERIINMLDVYDDQIVVESKGIYSVEHFLSARRLMYWQVYLHKTAVAAEQMLVQLIRRAKFLTVNGFPITSTPSLTVFLKDNIELKDFHDQPDILEHFAMLDDSDIWASLKYWKYNNDAILSKLASTFLDRDIFKIIISNDSLPTDFISEKRCQLLGKFEFDKDDVSYFLTEGIISNSAYVASNQKIKIKTKTNELLDIEVATDLPNIKAMSQVVVKHFVSWMA